MQTIVVVYKPVDEDSWFLLETDSKCYEFKPGALEETSKTINRETLDLPIKGRKIQKVLTDNSALFIELDNDNYLVHAETSIDNKGNTIFDAQVWTRQEFDNEMENYLDEDDELREIRIV